MEDQKNEYKVIIADTLNVNEVGEELMTLTVSHNQLQSLIIICEENHKYLIMDFS